MIYCFIGTKAQLIKMAPVVHELRLKNIPFKYIDSGQHAGITNKLRQVFELPEPDIYLNNTLKDITSTSEAIKWYLSLLWKSRTDQNWLKREVFPEKGYCLIHGDTLSTILGLHMARRAGMKIAHVEAGLRSFRWFDPFPEEIIRIVCMKQADLLFAPSMEAEKNLHTMKVKGQIIQIDGNTVSDSIRWITSKSAANHKIPTGPFAVATCHRLETIANRQRLTQIVDLFNHITESTQLVFVVHGPTRQYLQRYNLERRLNPAILVKDLLNYDEFISLLSAAQFVLSDGGSIQEECAFLGKPCLILRNTTERHDGLNRNAVLWKFDEKISAQFLLQVPQQNKAEQHQLLSPSAQIVNHLSAHI